MLHTLACPSRPAPFRLPLPCHCRARPVTRALFHAITPYPILRNAITPQPTLRNAITSHLGPAKLCLTNLSPASAFGSVRREVGLLALMSMRLDSTGFTHSWDSGRVTSRFSVQGLQS